MAQPPVKTIPKLTIEGKEQTEEALSATEQMKADGLPAALTFDDAKEIAGEEKALEFFNAVAVAGQYGDYRRSQKPRLAILGLYIAANDEKNKEIKTSKALLADVKAAFKKYAQAK